MEANFIPETKPIDVLLQEFQRDRKHMVVVLDEYGGVSGVVTMEDVLEEIVGEIVDEYDKDLVDGIRQLDDHTAEALGKVHVDEINEQLGLQLPDDGDFDTIGGFVFSRLGHIPVVGEELLADKQVSVPVVEARGCLIGRVPKVDAHGEVTYTNQIARILQDRCVRCHREGEIAPFPLVDYDEVVGWSEMMREVIGEGRMPPWFADPKHGEFSNDARMSEDEKKLFNTWVDNGCPQGDLADMPEPREWIVGWQIPEPDQVIYMRDEPYTVQAEGTV